MDTDQVRRDFHVSTHRAASTVHDDDGDDGDGDGASDGGGDGDG